jgi:hypothetical protein
LSQPTLELATQSLPRLWQWSLQRIELRCKVCKTPDEIMSVAPRLTVGCNGTGKIACQDLKGRSPVIRDIGRVRAIPLQQRLEIFAA